VGLKRWASTNFRYEYPVTNTLGVDFTLYASGLEFNVPQGGSLDVPLTTRGFVCADNRADISASPGVSPGVPWPVDVDWDSVFSWRQDRMRIRDGFSNESTFTLRVEPGAPARLYPVRLMVTSGVCSAEHSVEITVNVYEPTPGGPPNRFVIVEGFAQFQISYIDVDANTVGAYAIGPIMPCVAPWCPEGIGEDPAVVSGLIPRLLPW